MINTVVRLTSFVSCLLLAFIASIQLDVVESSIPLGTEYSLSLTTSENSVSRSQIIDDLHGLSDRYRLVLDKVVPDPGDYLNGRSLYRFGSSPPTNSQLSWYNPDWHGQLLPASELGVASLNGQYALSGPETGVHALREWAAVSQVEIAIAPSPGWGALALTAVFFSGGYAALAACLLLMLAVVMAWHAARARPRALKVLAGTSTSRIIGDELFRLTTLLAVPAVLAVVLAVAVVLFRSGSDYIRPFLEAFLPFLSLGIVVAVAFSVAVSFFNWPRVALIASRMSPLGRFRFVSEVVKVMTLVVTMVFLPLAVTTIGTSLTTAQAAERWVDLKDQLTINNFGTVPGTPEDERVGRQFKSLVTDASDRGILRSATGCLPRWRQTELRWNWQVTMELLW